MKKRVVIIGGGVTGLALAHALERAQEPCSVKLLEASAQLGGNVHTIRHNGFIIDPGPDSWVATKPTATQLARTLGLGDELIGTRPDSRRVFIVWQRKLHPLPEGMILGVPTEMKPLLESELLDWDAKLRAGLDYFVPARRWHDDEDETIAAFITRRLGAQINDRIAGPLLGGIFAGDAAALSVRACVPQLVEAEREHGSIVVAMRALKEKRRQAQLDPTGLGPPSAFLSLKRGLGDLVTNLAHRLRDAEVSTGRSVQAIVRGTEARWAVQTDRGTLHADHVALAVPANVAGPLVRELDPTLADMCGELEYASAGTVFLAFRKFDVRHPLDSTGFLVPRAEGRPILACTFVSSKWDHRAPAGQVLMRVFLGGAGNEAILDRDDADLVKIARAQLQDLLGIDRAPAWTKVFRFRRSSPQPHLGHLPRVRRLLRQVATHEGLHVGGNGYIGTGLSDAIRQGQEIAEQITPLAP